MRIHIDSKIGEFCWKKRWRFRLKNITARTPAWFFQHTNVQVFSQRGRNNIRIFLPIFNRLHDNIIILVTGVDITVFLFTEHMIYVHYSRVDHSNRRI